MASAPSPRSSRRLQTWLRGSAPLVNNSTQARDHLARERNWLSGAIRNSTMLAVLSISLLYDIRVGERGPIARRTSHPWALPFGLLFGAAAILNLIISSRSFLHISRKLKHQFGFAETSLFTSLTFAFLLLLGAAVGILQLIDLAPPALEKSFS